MLQSSCKKPYKWAILGDLAPQKRPKIKFYIKCSTDIQRYTPEDATNQKQSIYDQLLFGRTDGHFEDLAQLEVEKKEGESIFSLKKRRGKDFLATKKEGVRA